MAWEWSHSADGLANVQGNLTRLPREQLEVIYAEWKSRRGGHFRSASVSFFSIDLDDRMYQRALSAARYIETEVLAERIYAWAEKHSTCDNGGWNAWVCPHGCHTVGFGDDRMPSVSDVARALRAAHEGNATGEDTDVRLQVLEDGTWSLHVGDASYDTDHHGYWGASSIPSADCCFAAKDTARELIDECEGHAAQERDNY